MSALNRPILQSLVWRNVPHVTKHRNLNSTSFNAKNKLLLEKNMSVPTFGGAFWTKTQFDTRITPIGSNEHPNMDRALIKLVSKDQETSKDQIQVDVQREGEKLSIIAENKSLQDPEIVTQDVRIPMVHNVNVEAVGKAKIQAESFMESDYCHLKTEDGDIIASEIKSGTIAIESNRGEVLCSGHCQGNIAIKTTSGNVIGDKRITGQTLDINTDSGDIRLASCYSETSTFSTNTGSMNLRNLHHEAYIAVYEKGDVTVQGMDGSGNIFVAKGDVNCQISRVRAESRIHVEKGDINIKISDAYPLKISIEANDIFPDAKFKKLGVLEENQEAETKKYNCSLQPDKFSPHILIIAEDGNVNLESQDWAASLGLKMPISYGQGSHIQFEIPEKK